MNSDLTLDLTADDARPYFLWSEEMTLGQLKRILAGEQGEYLRWVYSGRILREARIGDVWHFFAPDWVAQNWSKVSPYLGRKRGFWEHCLRVWRKHGRLE